MSSRSLIGLFLAVGAIGACRPDRSAENAAAASTTDAAAPSIASYTFTATNYAFAGPAQIPAGTVTLRLANKGTEPHHFVLVRLEQEKTYADLDSVLKLPGMPPEWVRMVGGPNAVDPNGESNATMTLPAGRYAAICLIPSTDGVPHFAKGMVSHLEVTPSTAAAAPAPTADVAIKLVDYDFQLSAPLRAGTTTIRVDNGGPQVHEVVLARFAPGKSLADFHAWAAGGFKTAPPASFVGGTAPMHSGEQNAFTVALEPGEYALICFVPDAKDGKEHLAHGMAKQVTVS